MKPDKKTEKSCPDNVAPRGILRSGKAGEHFAGSADIHVAIPNQPEGNGTSARRSVIASRAMQCPEIESDGNITGFTSHPE